MNSPNSGEVIVAVPFAKRPLETRVQAPQHPKWDGELFVYLLFGLSDGDFDPQPTIAINKPIVTSRSFIKDTLGTLSAPAPRSEC